MWLDNSKDVLKVLKRDHSYRPCLKHPIGSKAGRTVYISEFALKHPYFDFSQGFEGLRPASRRKRVRRFGYSPSFVSTESSFQLEAAFRVPEPSWFSLLAQIFGIIFAIVATILYMLLVSSTPPITI